MARLAGKHSFESAFIELANIALLRRFAVNASVMGIFVLIASIHGHDHLVSSLAVKPSPSMQHPMQLRLKFVRKKPSAPYCANKIVSRQR